MSSEEAENRENTHKRVNVEGQYHDHTSARKRRLVDHTEDGFANSILPIMASKQLTHEDYTVGWICALALEMTAARTMLDEQHIPLPNPPQDQNAYVLGEICGHNVVITCLPSGVYGNNSAPVVATYLMSTFRSITVPLLVGIGGGVPQPGHDIRLGDVVVGTPSPDHPAVVQYDFGKTVSNGVFEHKGNLNKPKISLLNVLNSLRSMHQLKRTQIPEYISNAFEEYRLGTAEFGRPEIESDVLFETECDHVPEGLICKDCGPLEPINRAPRQSTDPVIHYGTIASGNQVIKHAKTRDQLARKHGVLCFEMEAASLMDAISCLVIRGICDYCDTKKHKQFQGYAALASAAYAKEFLSLLPKTNSSRPVVTHQTSSDKLQHRQLVMEALDFDEADSRQASVRKAHSQTCKWLLEQQEYRDWTDPDRFSEHHGLLWIKGKAGSGKSTLMKFVLEETLRSKSPNHIIISFFFNARGQDLEKSTLGMYRSLVHQVLEQLPELQMVLDQLSTSTNFDHHKLQFLRDAFEYVLKNLRSKTLVCFVDALDECPEEQIRNMVDFFTDLGRFATTEKVLFFVCFSSRYYPNVSVEVSQQLDLEKQNGHSNDIAQYIKSELKIGNSKRHESLKAEIAQKSNGIFLWVVLVVQILKREYDRGMVHKMSERIKTIPQELDKLFRDILTRDNNDLPGLMLCMQWMLFSKRQLSREEFYFALRSGGDDFKGEPWDIEDVPVQAMDNFILTCSKGLVELTRGKAPVVQFIHESVREFLAKPDALLNLWHGFRDLSEGLSHERLKECCYRQVLSCNSEFLKLGTELPRVRDPDAVRLRETANESFPFLDYAVHHVMVHADLAGTSQVDFLLTFNFTHWSNLYNLIQKFKAHRLPKNMDISQILIKMGLAGLLRQFWCTRPPGREVLFQQLSSQTHDRNIDGCRTILSARYSYDQPEASAEVEYVGAILDIIEGVLGIHSLANAHIRCLNLIRILLGWPDCTDFYGMLQLAAQMKHETAFRLSLELSLKAGVSLNKPLSHDSLALALSNLFKRRPRYCHTTKTHSKAKGKTIQGYSTRLGDETNLMSDTISCISVLLAKGFSFSSLGDEKPSPLAMVTEWADESVLKFLSNHGACICPGEVPLHLATRSSNTHAIRFWLDMGIDVNGQDENGNTPIHYVDGISATQLLIDRGALTYTKNIERYLDCWLSCYTRGSPIVDLLLRRLADPNDAGSMREAPLHLAITYSNAETVDILLCHGADANSMDIQGLTPLHTAVSRSDTGIIEVLLRHGANINSADSKGETPLHLAISWANTEITKLLLRHKANTDSASSIGATPLHLAVGCSKKELVDMFWPYEVNVGSVDSPRLILPYPAVSASRTEMVELLLQHGASINSADSDGETPLHRAVILSKVEVADTLLRHGANADSINKQGRTPLHLAASALCIKIIELLLKHGASINSADSKGETPLHLAVICGAFKTAMILLHYGANPYSNNNQGQSPWGLANSAGWGSEMIEALHLSERTFEQYM